jgi:hypothetical protein
MRRRLAFTVVWGLVLGIGSRSPAQPDVAAPGGKGVSGVPLREVAAPLREAWLRFHGSELCLGVDSVFVFQPKSVEVWCRVQDVKNYQALVALLQPLQKTYRIDIYATHPEREKKAWSLDDEDPLPSLWTNAELRAYFRDPFAGRAGTPDDGAAILGPDSRVDPAVKRRMKLYGDQLLEWTAKAERLADDLPALAAAGFGADSTPDTQGRARTVCLEHVREVGKLAERLEENLVYALPRGSGDSRAAPPEKPAEAAGDPARDAWRVSDQASEIVRRIRRFLYPQAHTVGLADLREPGLLDSLKTLQTAVTDFERSAGKVR